MQFIKPPYYSQKDAEHQRNSNNDGVVNADKGGGSSDDGGDDDNYKDKANGINNQLKQQAIFTNL